MFCFPRSEQLSSCSLRFCLNPSTPLPLLAASGAELLVSNLLRAHPPLTPQFAETRRVFFQFRAQGYGVKAFVLAISLAHVTRPLRPYLPATISSGELAFYRSQSVFSSPTVKADALEQLPI